MSLRRSLRLAGREGHTPSSNSVNASNDIAATPSAPESHHLCPSEATPESLKQKNPPRPPNAFMIFRREYCELHDSKEEQSDQQSISIKCGEVWREMSEEEKKPYYQRAAREKILHMQKYPGYKFRPERKGGDVRIRRKKCAGRSKRGYEKGVTMKKEHAKEEDKAMLMDEVSSQSQHALPPVATGDNLELEVAKHDSKEKSRVVQAELYRPEFSERAVPDLQLSLGAIQSSPRGFHEDAYPLTLEIKTMGSDLGSIGEDDDIGQWFDFRKYDMKQPQQLEKRKV